MLEGNLRGRWIASLYVQLLIHGYRVKLKAPILKSPNLRLSLSLSLLLLLHRLLFRFFSRLRSNLLIKDAAPFRRRNPRISKTLTSPLAPAIGASLAGFALGVYPGDQLRITIAIYVATRSLEFASKALEEDGWFKGKPWWWGSWLLMPVATGQLLHAFVFDRDCFPKVHICRLEAKEDCGSSQAQAYGDFILDHTPNYVQRRPASYPPNLSWPSTNKIVDSLAEMSRLNWPYAPLTVRFKRVISLIIKPLQTVYITNPFPLNPNPPSLSHPTSAHHVPSPPVPHLSLMCHPPPFHALLLNNPDPLHPNRLPHDRQILRRLLHTVRSTSVEELRAGAVARAQRSREESAKDISFPDRRNRHILGLHLSIPESLPTNPDAFIALGAWGCIRRHVGLHRSKGGPRTLSVQYQT